MKIFLYNEHAIKNIPAKVRADTVTISMRDWHRFTATTGPGEHQSRTPEPSAALHSRLGRYPEWVPWFNLKKKNQLPVSHFWCTHYTAKSSKLDRFCPTGPLFPAAHFLAGCFCSFLEIKLNLWKWPKSVRCSYKTHILTLNFTFVKNLSADRGKWNIKLPSWS